MDYQIKSFGIYAGIDYDEIWVEHDGVIITFSNFGARINRWLVPDSNGEQKSIVLGFDNASHAVEGKGYYYGATIAPIAGRVNKGQFTLNNDAYQLTINDGKNHLHGGHRAVDLQKWDYDVDLTDEQFKVTFSYTWPDGYNGYPGPITMKVIYSYTFNHTWRIEYVANTEKATLFNPTNHVYFNLSGNNQEDILKHSLQINADHYLPVLADGLPQGTIESVTATPFDLREAVVLGTVLNSNFDQVAIKDGFDHPFYLNESNPKAILSLDENNIRIECRTSSPCIVVYTSQVVDQPIAIWGQAIKKYGGITLETQMEPDAINHTNFHDISLYPDQTFHAWTEYQLIKE
ncbi:aldose epimerase family protein [Fundicoccus culcitae]|uniref:Aldose 1-epimerase n=1 Tax=Fundicoccus culcitae TaxID=2969821 RepID=A0ABY5P6T8_9LACT|nr:aldose epimerase family protein [Fundicoccus culcitae]UUX34452.1 galactose mutarotase [Fundicoccus culcitae]